MRTIILTLILAIAVTILAGGLIGTTTAMMQHHHDQIEAISQY